MHSPALAKRFWAKVDRSDVTGCWPWSACRWPSGYGQFRLSHGTTNAHRVAYELAIGPIPEGLEIDHLCRNKACVNPAHLEAVTHRENDLRGVGVSAINVRKMHCPQGHPLSGDNLYVCRGRRQCRTCRRVHAKRIDVKRRLEREQIRAAREGEPVEAVAR